MTLQSTPNDTAAALLADIRDITSHQGATSPRLADALAARGWTKTAEIITSSCPAREPVIGYPCTADVAGHAGPHSNAFGSWHTPDAPRPGVDRQALAAKVSEFAAECRWNAGRKGGTKRPGWLHIAGRLDDLLLAAQPTAPGMADTGTATDPAWLREFAASRSTESCACGSSIEAPATPFGQSSLKAWRAEHGAHASLSDDVSQALSTLYSAEDGSREKDAAYDVIRAALAAARAGEAVDREAMGRAVREALGLSSMTLGVSRVVESLLRHGFIAARGDAAPSVTGEQVRALGESYARDRWPDATVDEDPDLIDASAERIRGWLAALGIEVRP